VGVAAAEQLSLHHPSTKRSMVRSATGTAPNRSNLADAVGLVTVDLTEPPPTHQCTEKQTVGPKGGGPLRRIARFSSVVRVGGFGLAATARLCGNSRAGAGG